MGRLSKRARQRLRGRRRRRRAPLDVFPAATEAFLWRGPGAQHRIEPAPGPAPRPSSEGAPEA